VKGAGFGVSDLSGVLVLLSSFVSCFLLSSLPFGLFLSPGSSLSCVVAVTARRICSLSVLLSLLFRLCAFTLLLLLLSLLLAGITASGPFVAIL
jgi:hypothetical protein